MDEVAMQDGCPDGQIATADEQLSNVNDVGQAATGDGPVTVDANEQAAVGDEQMVVNDVEQTAAGDEHATAGVEQVAVNGDEQTTAGVEQATTSEEQMAVSDVGQATAGVEQVAVDGDEETAAGVEQAATSDEQMAVSDVEQTVGDEQVAVNGDEQTATCDVLTTAGDEQQVTVNGDEQTASGDGQTAAGNEQVAANMDDEQIAVVEEKCVDDVLLPAEAQPEALTPKVSTDVQVTGMTDEHKSPEKRTVSPADEQIDGERRISACHLNFRADTDQPPNKRSRGESSSAESNIEIRCIVEEAVMEETIEVKSTLCSRVYDL
jgi:hypothetical protein